MRDFLNEIIAESEASDPGFVAKVEEALRARRAASVVGRLAMARLAAARSPRRHDSPVILACLDAWARLPVVVPGPFVEARWF